jgi:hypothetical protein
LLVDAGIHACAHILRCEHIIRQRGRRVVQHIRGLVLWLGDELGHQAGLLLQTLLVRVKVAIGLLKSTTPEHTTHASQQLMVD